MESISRLRCRTRHGRIAMIVVTLVGGATFLLGLISSPAHADTPGANPAATTATTVAAQTSTTLVPITVPTAPVAGATPTTAAIPSLTTPSVNTSPGTVSLNVDGALNKPSESITIIVLLTLLTVAPSLLIMLSSFTRIVIVLSLTRNAMGLQTVPPNQVIVGLALFLSLFIMGPTISAVNNQAVQPYLHGHMTESQAFTAGEKPIRTWMLKQTRQSELALFTSQPGQVKPKSPDDVSLTDLIPAFILSEIKTAFIIGFVIFIPFLVIDLIVSSSLMSMGMMMLPPVLVSLPFKILLFVLVDGWGLIVQSLLKSFR